MALTKATLPSYGTLDEYMNRTILDRLAKDAPTMSDIQPDADGDYGPGIMRLAEKGVNFIRVPAKTYKVGNCKLTKPMMFIGDGVEGIDPVAATFVKPTNADYCIAFDSTGFDRPQGGGIRHVHIRGEKSSDTGNLVIGKTWSYLRFEYCGFHNLTGSAIHLQDVAESKINDNLFRRVGASNGSVIFLGDYVGSPLFNVNNLHVKDNTFGLCSGAWVRGTDKSNVDMFWFTDNKVEWDNTPASANVEGEYVLDFGQLYRAWITGNGFTHFRDDEVHNKYVGVLRMGEKCGYTVFFHDNQLFGCKGHIFDVKGGSLDARNNMSNRADASGNITWSVTSNKRCHIEPPTIIQSNGNMISTSITKSATFISSHEMGGTVGNTFVSDAESSLTSVLKASAGQELRRLTLPEDLTTGNDSVRIVCRVKALGGTGSVKLNTNGTIDIATTSTGVQDAWVNLTFVVPSAQIGAGSVRLINAGNTDMLLDGVKMERADYIDVAFAWNPGSVENGGMVVSPAQGGVFNFIDPSVAIKGISTPMFTGDLKGLLPIVRQRTSRSSWEVVLLNMTGQQVTPTITRCFVRVFL